MIPVFILSYKGGEYFSQWFKITDYQDTRVYFIDNGQQSLPDGVPCFYATSHNIGCAGGWNLICRIGFEALNFEQIIIGSDDAVFSQAMLMHMWNEIKPNALVGMYDNGFGFAMFGLHRQLYQELGPFDENFIYGSNEDSDYQRRMTLTGKTYTQLLYPCSMNSNYTARVAPGWYSDAQKLNIEYFARKWGGNSEFPTPFNDPHMPLDKIPIQPRTKEVYGDISEYPSETEYRLFLEGYRNARQTA